MAKNVSLSLHNLFCLKRESKVKSLPDQAKRLQEQREWKRAYEQLKAWEENLISSDDEEELSRQITVSSASGPSTSETGSANCTGCSGVGSGVLSVKGKRGLSVNSNEI